VRNERRMLGSVRAFLKTALGNQCMASGRLLYPHYFHKTGGNLQNLGSEGFTVSGFQSIEQS
jgi:hypothetical protein